MQATCFSFLMQEACLSCLMQACSVATKELTVTTPRTSCDNTFCSCDNINPQSRLFFPQLRPSNALYASSIYEHTSVGSFCCQRMSAVFQLSTITIIILILSTTLLLSGRPQLVQYLMLLFYVNLWVTLEYFSIKALILFLLLHPI